MGFSTLHRKHRILFTFGGIIFVAAGVALSSQYFFRIEHIEVVGEDIGIAIDKSQLERNLLFFPTEKLAGELMQRYPILESVYITKKFPQTLQISVKKHTPFAVVESEEQFMAVSSNGIVLGTIDPEKKLPVIRLPLGVLRVGQEVTDGRLTAALTFIETIGPSLSISLVGVGSGASLVAYSPEMNIIFPQDDTVSTRAAALQRLITGFRIKGKLPATIDLRFDKPVIKN